MARGRIVMGLKGARLVIGIGGNWKNDIWGDLR